MEDVEFWVNTALAASFAEQVNQQSSGALWFVQRPFKLAQWCGGSSGQSRRVLVWTRDS